MQTFLPYADFQTTVECLDWKRLGKQRGKAKQILATLISGSGWRNHPAVKMWKNYEPALAEYMNCCILEWIKRGYKNTMQLSDIASASEMPWWFGDNDFHASHRSNLLRKNAMWYGKFGWTEHDSLPYICPSKNNFANALT